MKLGKMFSDEDFGVYIVGECNVLMRLNRKSETIYRTNTIIYFLIRLELDLELKKSTNYYINYYILT